MTDDDFAKAFEVPQLAAPCNERLTLETEGDDFVCTCDHVLGHTGPHQSWFSQVDGPQDQTLILVTWRRYDKRTKG